MDAQRAHTRLQRRAPRRLHPPALHALAPLVPPLLLARTCAAEAAGIRLAQPAALVPNGANLLGELGSRRSVDQPQGRAFDHRARQLRAGRERGADDVRLALASADEHNLRGGIDDLHREGDALGGGLGRVGDRQHPPLRVVVEQIVPREERADVAVATEAEQQQVELRVRVLIVSARLDDGAVRPLLGGAREHARRQRAQPVLVVARRRLGERLALVELDESLVDRVDLVRRNGHLVEPRGLCAAIVGVGALVADAALVDPRDVELVPLDAIHLGHGTEHLDERAAGDCHRECAAVADRDGGFCADDLCEACGHVVGNLHLVRRGDAVGDGKDVVHEGGSAQLGRSDARRREIWPANRDRGIG